MKTIIPAPKRTIRLEPMAPMHPLDLKGPIIRTTQDALSFIAMVAFLSMIVLVCMMIKVPAPIVN